MGMTWCIQVASRISNSLPTAPKSPLPDPCSATSYATNASRKTQTNSSSSSSLSEGPSSSSSVAPPRMIHTPPENSSRPRKKSQSSQVVNARVIPWAQQQIQNPTVSDPATILPPPDSATTILSGGTIRHSGTTELEDHLFSTMIESSMPLGTDFFDWEVQLLNAESMLPELGNMSDLSAGLGPQDAEMPDIVMPEAGCGMAIDPWDIDL